MIEAMSHRVVPYLTIAITSLLVLYPIAACGEAPRHRVPQLFRTRGYRDAELGRHAGAYRHRAELGTDAGLVRMDRLRPGREGNGVDGDPTRRRRAGPGPA